MRKRVELATPHRYDIDDLVADMMLDDWDECVLRGREPEEAIVYSVRHSVESYAARSSDGRLISLFGVGLMPGAPTYGMPWMLCTNEITRFKRQLVPLSRSMIGTWASRYDHLANHVHDKNARAKAFVRWLGFDLGEVEPMGPQQAPFRRFSMQTKGVLTHV